MKTGHFRIIPGLVIEAVGVIYLLLHIAGVDGLYGDVRTMAWAMIAAGVAMQIAGGIANRDGSGTITVRLYDEVLHPSAIPTKGAIWVPQRPDYMGYDVGRDDERREVTSMLAADAEAYHAEEKMDVMRYILRLQERIERGEHTEAPDAE